MDEDQGRERGQNGKMIEDRGQREEGGGRDPYGLRSLLGPEAAVRFHFPCLTSTYHPERACCGVLPWDAPGWRTPQTELLQ